MSIRSFTFLISLFFLIAASRAQTPSFPGAEGWGALSIGGRGGNVIEVTNLNDAGPGSLREACSASGARTVVFRTGGVIELLSEIQIMNPFITIAGQTAPGDGIVIKNFPLTIFTHDVILRGLRIRIGNDFPTLNSDNRDCISIQSGSSKVIVDHCSLSWGSDEIVSILDSGVNSITIQHCIISEGLFANIHPKGFHSMGLLVGYDASKTSVHHNLFAHNAGRNPLIARRTDHEFINNVIYDWKFNSDLLEENTQLKLDFIGNYYKPLTYTSYPELPIHLDFDSSTTLGTQLFMHDNFFSPNLPFITAQQLTAMGPGNAALFANSSLLSTASTVTIQSPLTAYNDVLNCAGALHPLRDTTDKRIIASVIDSTGGLIDCIGSAPIFLDSGSVLSTSDTTLTYSMLGKPIVYSAASRRIEIISGTGAGQVRFGVDETPVVIDTANLILQSKINSPWTINPDSTSVYKFYAGCNTAINAYPSYSIGVPETDNDHDGMADSWEASKGLNPADGNDQNIFTLDNNYTNLEMYLNGFYQPCGSVNSVENIVSTDKLITISPNPFSDFTTIQTKLSFSNATMIVYNSLGEKMMERMNINGSQISFSRNTLRSGIYFLRIFQGSFMTFNSKLIIIN